MNASIPTYRSPFTQLEEEPTMHRPLIDADAVALRWGITKSQVYRLAREGRIPAVTLGRYYRFSLPALEAFEARGGVRTD